MSSPQLTQSVIICTKNRPTELKSCISSLINQKRKPDEIIVIDDGEIDRQIFQTISKLDIKFIYHKKQTPGLTKSRNIGVSLASGDIITFIDDDVILDSDYNFIIMTLFENDIDNQIAGVTGGIILQQHPFRYLLLRLFFLDGPKPGSILPSGIGVLVKASSKPSPIEVQWLSGCNMSYRKHIFHEFSFNDRDYLEYAWGEDRDFSYQISKKYKLLGVPDAKLIHTKSPTHRLSTKQFGIMEIYNLHLFYKQHLPHKPKNYIAYSIAISGIIIKNLLKSFIPHHHRDSLKQLTGNILGLYKSFTNK